MEKDKHITEVQFRLLRGEVIAVFPYEIDNDTNVLSYMHLGQHSGCSWDINNWTKKASSEQYVPLFKELESLGYNLKVINRRNHKKYLSAYHEISKRLRELK